ncbi:hypothetical protein ACFQ4K_02000 [Tistrella bauzanensis]
MTTAAPPPIPSETLVMRVDRPGGPEALVPAMVPLRRPGPGEVLMATRAIGVNHLDLYYRDGTLPFDAIPAPAGAPAHVPGLASVGRFWRWAPASTASGPATVWPMPARRSVPMPPTVCCRSAGWCGFRT